jgi:5-deoxy-glucuronate isomerase
MPRTISAARCHAAADRAVDDLVDTAAAAGVDVADWANSADFESKASPGAAAAVRRNRRRLRGDIVVLPYYVSASGRRAHSLGATDMIPPISPSTCIIRNTGATRGRTRSVAPGKTAAQYLHYGRIVLRPDDSPVHVEPGGLETGLICLKGEATVAAGGATHRMTPYDSMYVPRDTAFDVAPGDAGCDFAEIAAPVDNSYPLQFVSYADVQRDPGLHFPTGAPGSRRTLNILLGKNIKAGRIMAGVTFSDPGNWTSWPPHEHAHLAEEAYLYVDMPAPAFGVQLVYVDKANPELATIVRDGDVVLMPQGYHPNVAAPGHQINFVWMMAANRERVDRQFGVVNVHPDYAAAGSGLDKGRG